MINASFKTIIVLFFFSCKAPKNIPSETGMPTCLREKIENMSRDKSEGKPVSVTQFSYKGQKVYYMVAPCCDKFNIVYDSACNILGYPDGGFTGRGDGKMPDFEKEAINPKIIWQAKNKQF